MESGKFFDMFLESAKNAYIKVMGEEKWLSLNDKEKHDAVMFLANDMIKVMGTI